MDSLGPIWGQLCKKQNSVRFLWAHDGKEVSGWIEFHEAGILLTSFGNGTWRLLGGDNRVVELVFGTSIHVCRLSSAGRFVVESQFFKQGKKRKCWTVGWPDNA